MLKQHCSSLLPFLSIQLQIAIWIDEGRGIAGGAIGHRPAFRGCTNWQRRRWRLSCRGKWAAKMTSSEPPTAWNPCSKMAYLFPTIAGDNADGDKKKNKKSPAAKSWTSIVKIGTVTRRSCWFAFTRRVAAATTATIWCANASTSSSATQRRMSI